jgi:glutamyl-tRNA reductase
MAEPTEETSMSVFVAGLSYKTAPVALREQLAVSPSKLGCHGCRLRIVGGLDEVVLLSTCNRVEIYGVAPTVNGNVKSIFQLLAKFPCDVRQHLYVHEGELALRHLFSVVSGLDSMVLGETEITGQVKTAYENAQTAGLTGRVLNRAFQKAFSTAKEIRTRTGIGRGATSVGSVAVELAEKIFREDLLQHKVMIIGAGKMGEACIRHLAKRGTRSILVSNRSFDRAQALAAEFNGQAIRFDDCLKAMTDVDIVVSSTGCPETILHRQDIQKLMAARRNRPLFLIDIAVPRDIDPDVQHIENVYLYNIDDLETIVRENTQLRQRDLDLCHRLIEARATTLMKKISEKPHDIRIQSQSHWLPDGAAVGSREPVFQ